MTVQSTVELRNSPVIKYGIGDAITVTRTYRIKTDGAADETYAELRAGIGAPGVKQAGGVGITGTTGEGVDVLRSCTLTREPDKIANWIAVCEYGPVLGNDTGGGGGGKGGGQTNDGDPTDDPFEFADTIEFDTMYKMIDVWQAEFIGLDGAGDAGDGNIIKEGSTQLICNSARMPRDPPYQIEYAVPIYRVTQNRRLFPAGQLSTHVNAVNEDMFTYNQNQLGVNLKAPIGTVLCQGISGGSSIIAGKLVSKVTYTIAIDPLGWDIKMPDIGYERVFDPDEGDGPSSGMDAGEGEQANPVARGRPAVSTIMDPKGNFVRQPVQLDGYGHVLDTTNTNSVGHMMHWRPPQAKRTTFANLLNKNPVAPEGPVIEDGGAGDIDDFVDPLAET